MKLGYAAPLLGIPALLPNCQKNVNKRGCAILKINGRGGRPHSLVLSLSEQLQSLWWGGGEGGTEVQLSVLYPFYGVQQSLKDQISAWVVGWCE
jgi:hypothetical protein